MLLLGTDIVAVVLMAVGAILIPFFTAYMLSKPKLVPERMPNCLKPHYSLSVIIVLVIAMFYVNSLFFNTAISMIESFESTNGLQLLSVLVFVLSCCGFNNTIQRSRITEPEIIQFHNPPPLVISDPITIPFHDSEVRFEI